MNNNKQLLLIVKTIAQILLQQKYKQCKWFPNYTQNEWEIYRVQQKKVKMIFMDYMIIVYII